MSKINYTMSEERKEKLMEDLDRRQFELKSTDSLIWWIYAEETYRSSEILASQALQANKKCITRVVEDFKKNDKKVNDGRRSTIEEDIDSADSNQIRIAYFLLSRALELLLKAIIIEMEPNSFFDKISYKIKMGKNGHDIFKMIQKTGVSLSNEQEDYLKLLNHYPFIGTYPIPLAANSVTEERKLKNTLQKSLNHKNYEEVSILYDLVLEKYNAVRIPKGKTKRINYLKIKTL